MVLKTILFSLMAIFIMVITGSIPVSAASKPTSYSYLQLDEPLMYRQLLLQEIVAGAVV